MVFDLLHGSTLSGHSSKKRSKRRGRRRREPASRPVPAPRRFVTTRWSMVLEAGRKGTPRSRKALSELIELYWFPVYFFIRRRVDSADKARDLTQGFFARLLEKDALAVATPSRGRFRSFLLASVQNYLANARDHEQAQARGGSRIHINFEDAEECLNQESGLSPEQAYARRWGEKLLVRVLDALCTEYAKVGKGDMARLLKPRLTGGGDDSYAELAAQLGMSAEALRTAAFRFRERYGELLREEISHTVDDPADIEDELRFLILAFSQV